MQLLSALLEYMFSLQPIEITYKFQFIMKHKILSLLFVLLSLTHLSAGNTSDDCYTTQNRLFHISRSVNRNLVCYDVHLKDGHLDTDHPLEVYWINREEHPGARGTLSYIQRKLAYGYKVISCDEYTCVCTLTAYPSRRLTIRKHGDAFTCFISINNREAILKTLHVKSKPKNPLSVEYVELTGIDSDGKTIVSERVKK